MTTIPPTAGAGQPPGQSPSVGSSPAVGATPNAGAQAQALSGVSVVVKLMAELMVKAGPMSELGLALNDSIKKLAKFAQPGGTSPAAEQNQLAALQMRNQQMGPQVAQMRQAAAVGGAPRAA